MSIWGLSCSRGLHPHPLSSLLGTMLEFCNGFHVALVKEGGLVNRTSGSAHTPIGHCSRTIFWISRILVYIPQTLLFDLCVCVILFFCFFFSANVIKGHLSNLSDPWSFPLFPVPTYPTSPCWALPRRKTFEKVCIASGHPFIYFFSFLFSLWFDLIWFRNFYWGESPVSL